MEKPIHLFLLTGFLGAGKTTFLQRMIDGLRGHKIGIIMNEFGDLSVDGILLREQGMEVCELNQGSVFCSCLKGAFVDSLVDYSMLPIEYLFVESSGMADPSNIETLLTEVIGKAKGRSYDYAGAVCIVDAVNFMEQFDILLPIERQILAASYIIINKSDLSDEGELARIEAKIRQLNPLARVGRSSFCQVDFEFVKQNLEEVQQKAIAENHPKSSLNTPGNKPVAHTIRIGGIFAEAKFREFIRNMLPWSLRMKGFFHLDTGWKKIDISGMHVEMEATDIVREQSELVIISTQGLPALMQIYEQWDNCFDVDIELE